MRPAVFSAVLEQLAHAAARLWLDQLDDRPGELLGQVVDDRGGVVGRNLLNEAGDVLGGAVAEQLGGSRRLHLGQRLHRQARMALDEDRKSGAALLIRELGEQLRKVGGVLLLEQIQQVGGRANPEEPLDRVEDDVESALSRHDGRIGRFLNYSFYMGIHAI